jgi:aminoglycoside phosphotransferase (APT) family kinase protein
MAIASLHLGQKARKSSHAVADAARTLAIAETLSFLLQELAPRFQRVSEVLASRLADCSTPARITHGDFYAKQVVLGKDHATLLDLDELGWGDPMRDLGVFTAHLERDAVGERVAADRAKEAARFLLEGYGSTRAEIDSQVVDLYTAAASLWIAPHFFRGRDIRWQERTETLLEGIETLAFAKRPQRRKMSPSSKVEPFDPALPGA